MLSCTVDSGKYTVIQDAAGKLTALRYGEPWRDCVGDNLICALAYELDEARQVLAEALRESNCDGDLCAHAWHKQARAVIVKGQTP